MKLCFDGGMANFHTLCGDDHTKVYSLSIDQGPLNSHLIVIALIKTPHVNYPLNELMAERFTHSFQQRHETVDN